MNNQVGVHAGHQRLRDGVRNRRNQIDEPTTPFGVGYGKDEDPAMEPPNAGVFQHHLSVTQNVRAADLVDSLGIRKVKRFKEILEDIADTNRLATKLHPTGCDHDRQTFGQAADHLEAHRPGTDDDCRSELNHWYPAGGQDSAHLVTRSQVIAQGFGRVSETSEIDIWAIWRSRSGKVLPLAIEWTR